MTAAKRTPQDKARHRSPAEVAAGWAPRRGDVVYDVPGQRTGIVIALPEDTGAPVYHLCPPGGGRGWTARVDDLRPHEDDAPDGTTLHESVMPSPEVFRSTPGGREGV
ncbi:hypothetical protein [Streptomyces sp. MAR4 CNX-425]|uniref:hypothetical protein n=1 Tax=Streptomyces sp. MAR4 CNX-425 TaxID=3406343 RepID=UPI003B50EB55